MDHAIRVHDLRKTYGDTSALAGLDLEVRAGSVLGLLGPNGAGKTTAVRVLATLLRPDGGHASVCGHDVVRDARRVREIVGLTGQYAAVDEALTGAENLRFIARLLGRSRHESRTRARELLAGFGLTDAADRAVKTYSGGMRRRLDLAASLVTRPRVLFLDEPTTGLDPRSRLELWEVVRGLVADGVTVLLTTQYLDEADALAHEIAVVDHGRVIAHGTPDEVKARAGTTTLTVRPAEDVDLPVVTAEVAAVTGAVPHVTGSTVTAPVADRSVLPAVVARLDRHGIALAELSLRGASLDEVFLSLTGHQAGPSSQQSPTTEEVVAA